jgi:carboxyl-terminal processing protease
VPKKTNSRKHLVPYVVAGLLLYAVGFYSGGFVADGRSVVGAGDFFGGDQGKAANYSQFFKAKRLIEGRYPGKVDTQHLVDGATNGLVDGLGDPYSDYLTREEARQLDQSLAGEVEGIGVEIGVRGDKIVVISPLPGSPAAKAGIKAGDAIVGVDDKPTQGLTVNGVADLIRGKSGTTVRVVVQSPDARPRQLTIIRDKLKSPSVKLDFRGTTAILTVSRFGDGTTEDLQRAADQLLKRKATGIVLDLRSNPGGFLDGAVDASSLFLKQGVVVKERLKHDTEQQSVKKDGRLAKLPVVVLVDQGTASAAEIVAGALRDDRGVKLVGERTFGKGSVQDLIDLGGGTVLKLTIAEWLTPDGTSISKHGLEPDINVSSKDPDAQLNAALGQLR